MLNTLCSIVKKREVLTIILLYSIVVIITSWHHEIWRDEMRALSQAVDNQSVMEILKNKQAEGHPALWYVMLYYGYQLLHKPQILKILSVAVAILAMYIFVSQSPFSWPLKALLVFGYFPVYQYSVISRNYGLSMLLLFGFCCLYPKRFEKIVPIAIILVLLAHTNAYATVIAISIILSLMIEAVVRKKELVNMNVSGIKLLFAFSLAILGVVLFVLYMHPFHSRMAGIFSGSKDFFQIKSQLRPIFLPGWYFSEALGLRGGAFASVVIWTVFVYLLRKPFIFLIFFLSVVGMGLFHVRFSSPMYMWHQGLLIILTVAVFWLDSLESRTQDYPGLMGHLINRLSTSMNLFIVVLAVMQVCIAYSAVRDEIFHRDFSSSKSFGNLIRGRSEFEKAIIVGEPDFNIESLPYYVDNQIYMARERRFGKYVDWGAGKVGLSLNELLKTAIMLKNEYDRPILLTIGHRLSDQGPYEIKYSYNSIFTYDSDSLREFRKSTTKVASFRQAKEERYDVFLLK